jgi:hypothetical protein
MGSFTLFVSLQYSAAPGTYFYEAVLEIILSIGADTGVCGCCPSGAGRRAGGSRQFHSLH